MALYTAAMTLFALFNHLLNFVAPAVFVGTFLALLAPWVVRKSVRRGSWMVRALSNSLCGLCALLGGIWFFGHDGKMASYLVLVVASAASQFYWMQAWRK